MKRCLTVLMCMLVLMAGTAKAERVMVIADPHVIPASMVQPGAAADKMDSSITKMVHLSDTAFGAVIDTALLYRPDLVLIPGDLTKDGERSSHELVAAQLKRLQDAGIKVLVVPGNHDISNPNAYSYTGDQKTKVPNISDADFDNIYAGFMPAAVTARDPESHSYAAEPLRGVTVLGIDGTDGNAGEGSISENTLNWLLTQADAAVEKGNLVIAMCHWHIVEHVDQQTLLLSVSRMTNSEEVAEALAKHHVHLVLTGHFHVNDIATAFYGENLQDSIVDISTGSPVTYPCPYRWLEISADRSTVTVATDDIRTLDTIADMQAYSRAWQEKHTAYRLPDVARKSWARVDGYVAQMKNSSSVTTKAMGTMIDAALPKTDSARVELFKRHMGGAIVALYMLHSDANEPERPEKDAVKDSVYNGMTNMIVEVTGDLPEALQGMMAEMAIMMMETPVESICEDETSSSDLKYTNRTDDLYPVLKLNEPQPVPHEAIEQVETTGGEDARYDALGRRIQYSMPGQVIIRGGEKKIEN